jgi:hypothetical protein
VRGKGKRDQREVEIGKERKGKILRERERG